MGLTKEHWPESTEERRRLQKNGARVEVLRKKGDDRYRVWLKNQDGPGLPISRSFGDSVAKSIGVVSLPEVVTHNLEWNDRFIIIASNLVWECISNSEAVETCAKVLDSNQSKVSAQDLAFQAAQALLARSEERYKLLRPQTDFPAHRVKVVVLMIDATKHRVEVKA